ncbi:MAG: hypothetical protein OEV94_01825 [Deltaproteobacteria bacterium]|nr:hypothetical protein [Deltaproteobacteria bacterium]
MTYATYAEFAARYPTRLPEAEVSAHLLPFASLRLEALLALGFTVPFGPENLTAKDLTLDLAYLLVLQRGKNPAEAVPLAEQIDARIRGLLDAREAMITTSGTALFAARPHGGVWSSTSGRSPVFALEELTGLQGGYGYLE